MEPVLSLGRMPLANALLTRDQLDQPEPTYPLDVVFCRYCSLVQITETVPPEKLFREYLYFSSFSETILQRAEELSTRLIESRRLGPASTVVEIACNDGYLLQYYRKQGVPVLGIEPAVNVARVAERERAIPVICEFFGEALGRELRGRGVRAHVIHAHNVLAHVADLPGFLRGIRQVLRDDGIAVVEVPYVKDLIDGYEFDTIYHEHLCYFSVTSLSRLFERCGLIVQDVERISVHGGSLRILATPDVGVAVRESSRAGVKRVLDEEATWGVDRLEYYRDFAQEVEGLKRSLTGLLAELKRTGKRIAAYGAAAKGTVLLNYFGIGAEVLDFVVDRSTYKQGRYMPGVHLPVCAPARLVEAMPDYVLLLSWNFADEILQQQDEYRRRGGQFIIPIPVVRVV